MQITDLIKELKSKGYRITKAREEILSLFYGIHTSLSAQEVVSKLSLKIDRATVYRNLNFLSDKKIIKQIQLQGEVPKYELTDLKHHHHLICDNCKQIYSISSDSLEKSFEMVKSAAKRENDFDIKEHIFEFYGICRNCSKSQDEG